MDGCCRANFREENGALMGFLEHFDVIVETISCNNAATCTPICMETHKKISMNYEIHNQVTMTQFNTQPHLLMSSTDTSSSPQFY